MYTKHIRKTDNRSPDQWVCHIFKDGKWHRMGFFRTWQQCIDWNPDGEAKH